MELTNGKIQNKFALPFALMASIILYCAAVGNNAVVGGVSGFVTGYLCAGISSAATITSPKPGENTVKFIK